MNLPEFASGVATGSILIGIASKYLFATKRELSNVEMTAAHALAVHAEKEREKTEEQFVRLFDKLDKVSLQVADLRVEVANRYARRRASDQDQT